MLAPELYKKEVNANLKMLKADIDKLKARAEAADARVRTRFVEYVAGIDEKYDEVRERLADLADAGEDAREDVRRGLKEAWDRLAIAKRAAKARFH